MLRVDVYAFYLLLYAYITVLKRYSLMKEVVCARAREYYINCLNVCISVCIFMCGGKKEG